MLPSLGFASVPRSVGAVTKKWIREHCDLESNVVVLCFLRRSGCRILPSCGIGAAHEKPDPDQRETWRGLDSAVLGDCVGQTDCDSVSVLISLTAGSLVICNEPFPPGLCHFTIEPRPSGGLAKPDGPCRRVEMHRAASAGRLFVGCRTPGYKWGLNSPMGKNAPPLSPAQNVSAGGALGIAPALVGALGRFSVRMALGRLGQE